MPEEYVCRFFPDDDFWRDSVFSSGWFDSGYFFMSVYRGAGGPRIQRSIHFALEILATSTSLLYLSKGLGRISHIFYVKMNSGSVYDGFWQKFSIFSWRRRTRRD